MHVREGRAKGCPSDRARTPDLRGWKEGSLGKRPAVLGRAQGGNRNQEAALGRGCPSLCCFWGSLWRAAWAFSFFLERSFGPVRGVGLASQSRRKAHAGWLRGAYVLLCA